MKEYIFQIDDALYNKETGEAVFKPKFVNELVRCKDCMYADSYYHCTWANFWGTADDYCSRAKPKIMR